MTALGELASPVESHAERQVRRRLQIKKWREAADAGLFPRRQASKAIRWIRRRILRDEIRRCLRRVLAP